MTARLAATTPWLKGADRDALRVRLRAFERYFAGVIAELDDTPRTLHAAMRYAALGPGKRLRPLLALTAAEAVGGRWPNALPAAAAVECVHAFSLVHDDLPAMDDDDYRRGRLTTHKKYGEAIGLLAGDALLALAFQEAARLATRGVPPRRVVEAVSCLAHCSGSEELIAGQVMDLEAEGKKVGETGVQRIHLRKTGALMSAALRLGAIAGGGNDRRQNLLGRVGRNLGEAFQVQDDLLNAGSSLRRIGKRTGTDRVRGKATFHSAAGARRARARVEQLIDSALSDVRRLGVAGRNLEQVVRAVAVRER